MFGQTIKKLRKENKITQVELAKILECSQSMIARYEKNECEPTESSIIKAAKYFGVSTDYLLGLKDEYGYDINEDNTYNFEYKHGTTKLKHFERTKPKR